MKRLIATYLKLWQLQLTETGCVKDKHICNLNVSDEYLSIYAVVDTNGEIWIVANSLNPIEKGRYVYGPYYRRLLHKVIRR